MGEGMAETAVSILTPRENSGLSQHALEQLLPQRSIALDDRLVRDAERGSGHVSPVGCIEADGRAVEVLAGTTQIQKASGVQIGEYLYENVQWQIHQGCCCC
jgi:hypothetical protein